MTIMWVSPCVIGPMTAMPLQTPWATVSRVHRVGEGASSVSARLTPWASDGPLLVTVMV